MTRLCYYGSQAEVQAACDKIYVNMLRNIADNGDGTLYVAPAISEDKVTVAEAADQDLLPVPILGYKNGVMNKTSGYTTAWDTPKQCFDDGTKYWADVPAENTGGITCPTAEYSSDWVETVTEF